MPDGLALNDAGLSGRALRLAYFGDTVVHDADIELRAGRVTALLGPNGSGKSTLLRSLARLHKAESGTVEFDDGTDATALSPKDFSRRVSLLAQSRPVPGGIRVLDVCSRFAYTWRSSKDAHPGIADDW